MVGSLASEVEGVLKGRAETVTVRNDLNGGGVAPKGYKKVALNYPAGPPEFSRYRCGGTLYGVGVGDGGGKGRCTHCLLYTSPSPRD